MDIFSRCSMYNFTVPVDARTLVEARNTDYNITGELTAMYTVVWSQVVIESFSTYWRHNKELYVTYTGIEWKFVSTP